MAFKSFLIIIIWKYRELLWIIWKLREIKDNNYYKKEFEHINEREIKILLMRTYVLVW